MSAFVTPPPPNYRAVEDRVVVFPLFQSLNIRQCAVSVYNILRADLRKGYYSPRYNRYF